MQLQKQSNHWISNWFSNMMPVSPAIVFEDISFYTIENLYCACKTSVKEERAKIAQLPPNRAKRYARTVQLRRNWEEIKFAVMYVCLCKKFTPGTTWYSELKATGNETLVEWNNWGDKTWGIPARKVNDHFYTPTGQIGQNWLGRLLVLVRDEESLTQLYAGKLEKLLLDEDQLRELQTWVTNPNVTPKTDIRQYAGKVINSSTLPSQRK